MNSNKYFDFLEVSLAQTWIDLLQYLQNNLNKDTQKSGMMMFLKSGMSIVNGLSFVLTILTVSYFSKNIFKRTSSQTPDLFDLLQSLPCCLPGRNICVHFRTCQSKLSLTALPQMTPETQQSCTLLQRVWFIYLFVCVREHDCFWKKHACLHWTRMPYLVTRCNA